MSIYALTTFVLHLVCLLDFEVIDNSVVVDQSGYGNNGYLTVGAKIMDHPQICGHYADLTNQGSVILPDKAFVARPRTGITIACWVNIQGDVAGKHAIFTTVRMVGPEQFIGKNNLFSPRYEWLDLNSS